MEKESGETSGGGNARGGGRNGGRGGAGPPARPGLLAALDRNDTKSRILDAAYRRLASDGYTALSVREIARDAGVNHALINYHYRTKDQLVIAVLDEANRQLLERQRRMYAQPGEFSRKWARARRFYADDLASGFVRVQAELWAASISNAALRVKFLPRLRAWNQVVLDAVRDALSALEADGKPLPQPFSAEVLATWVANFWLGMEFVDLIAGKEERGRHKVALDAVQRLLESLDAPVAATKPSRPRTREKPA